MAGVGIIRIKAISVQSIEIELGLTGTELGKINGIRLQNVKKKISDRFRTMHNIGGTK